MGYFPDEEGFSLVKIMERIEKTDLTPSIEPIRQNLAENAGKIRACGIRNLAELRKAVKDKKGIVKFAQASGISDQYLTLLRREIEGWIADPVKLRSYTWLDQTLIQTLEKSGICTTEDLYASYLTDRNGLQSGTHIDAGTLETLFSLSDFSRVRWASPVVARMLVDLGYRSAKELSAADPEALYEKIGKLNGEKKYYKGKIGLRDIKRLIHEAQYT